MRFAVFVVLVAVAGLAPVMAGAQTPSVSAFEEAVGAAKSAMMTDPSEALTLAANAQKLASDASDPELAAATTLWLQGEALNRMNRPHDAVPVIEQGLAIVGASETKTKLHGDLMVARASAAGSTGDYAAAIANFQSAHEVFLELGEDRARAMTLQNIGSIYTDARDYKRALNYYEMAGEAYAGDPIISLTRLNNIGSAYTEMGDYPRAEENLRGALEIARELDSAMLKARILTNIAAVQLADGRIAAAEATVREGLALSVGGEPSGWEPFLWGVYAQSAFARGDTARAGELIGRTFEGEALDRTVFPFREFHESAYKIYTAEGRYRLAAEHLAAFKRLDDEARDVSAAANNALMGAQFDFASQELRIVNLRAQALEKEMAVERSEARQRTLILVGVAAMLLILMAGGALNYRTMRRSRNEVRAANTQLSESNTALEKALKAKSEFLATTSHEIRTPLNGILGMTQILLGQKSLAADVRERVQLVHGAGETMKAIVDDILDVAKLETGVVTVESAEFEIRQAIESVCQIWRDSASRKNIAFAYDLAALPSRGTGDERRVRQIIFNLLSNAVKFTDEGKVGVSAHVQDQAEGRRLIVEIVDTGPGIPADKHDAIFEPFTQLDGATTRKHGGTGLGLSICRKLARAMGGDVRVESVPGEGSTFILDLPLGGCDSAMNIASAGDQTGLLIIDANIMRQSILEATIDDPLSICVDDVDEAVATLARRRVATIIAMSEALGDAAGDMMETVMRLREASDARLIVGLAAGAAVEPAMLRLAGADEVVITTDNAVLTANTLLEAISPVPESVEMQAAG